MMETLVAQMTKEELVQIIETVIERKLLELIDDFDDVELKPEVRERLIRQYERVANGERGHAFEVVGQQLRFGEFGGVEAAMSTLEDFTIAEWRPTDEELDGR